MPNLTYQYVTPASGSHTRQPRSATSGFTTLFTQVVPNAFSAGNSFQPPPPPDPYKAPNGQSYTFAYENVSGGTGGPVDTPASSTEPSVITVGTSDILVLAVYLSPGGGPSGGTDSGVTIDQFDETTGALINDTFVKVAPDTPTGTATTEANVDGYVDTAASAVTITATTPTSSGVVFDHWVTLQSGGSIVSTSPTLAVVKGASSYALAMYKAPAVPSGAQATCNATVNSIRLITQTGIPGPLLTAEQWATEQAALQRCVQEGFLTQTLVNDLITEYENYASKEHKPPVSGPPTRS